MKKMNSLPKNPKRTKKIYSTHVGLLMSHAEKPKTAELPVTLVNSALPVMSNSSLQEKKSKEIWRQFLMSVNLLLLLIFWVFLWKEKCRVAVVVLTYKCEVIGLILFFLCIFLFFNFAFFIYYFLRPFLFVHFRFVHFKRENFKLSTLSLSL